MAQGHALISRAIVSACVSLLSRDFRSPFKRMNSNEPGETFSLRGESNQTLRHETVLESRSFRAGANRKESAKTARLNLTIHQTQQQLIIRKIRPSRQRQLQC